MTKKELKLLQEKFDRMHPAAEGMQAAREKETGKWCHIDEITKKPIYKRRFDWISGYHYGEAFGRLVNGKWIRINRKGQQVTGPWRG